MEGKFRQRELQERIKVTNRWQLATLGIEHALTKRLALGVYFPFVHNDRHLGFMDFDYEAHGLGDITIAAKYWLLEPSPGRWNVYVAVGLGMPTGDDDEKEARIAWTGGYKESFIQPGLGTWNPSIGVGVNKTIGELYLTASTGFTFTLGRNDANYDPAEPFTASIGAAYRLFKFGKDDEKFVGLSFGVNSLSIDRYDARDDVYVGGVRRPRKVRNTGGWWVSASPGIFFSPDGGAFTMYLSVPFPIYYNVHGSQAIERYGIAAGVAYRF